VSIDVAGRPGGWAAAGPAGGDTAYRTQSLKFLPVEEALDESVSFRTLFVLWLRAAIVSVTLWFVFSFLYLVDFISSIGSMLRLDDGGGSDTGLATIALLGQFLAFTLFWVLLLVPTIEEPIAEWRTLVENKAPAASSAYASIYGSLTRRQIPVRAVAMRVRSEVLALEAVNSRLVITDRSYIAYVSVFPYGTSLYVGWSMYRNRRGALLIGTFLKDLLGSLLSRTGLIAQMLRTEKVRAMREAVHSAVREGVEVAVQGIEVPISATFGHEVPIQDLGAPAYTGAPSPTAWAGTPAPAPVNAPPPSFPPPQGNQPYGI
jgi:hypothetical protein